MRIAALLSFYDEDPAWLRRMILSLRKLSVTHLVALDGAYALYPDAKARSPLEQHHAIWGAADEAGIKALLWPPATVWEGNEVEKRTRLFQIADEYTDADWYLIIDADEEITAAPDDVAARLTATPFDVAAVHLREPGHPQGTIVYDTFPMLYRAIPGITVGPNHYTYRTPDGRNLWGNATQLHLEPRADLTDIHVEHYTNLRHPDRGEAADTYYRDRDAAGIEDLPADRSAIVDRDLSQWVGVQAQERNLAQ